MFTLLRLIFLPAKVGVGTTKLGVKAGYRTGRLLGYRRLFVFAVGVGVGLLIAPMAGRELRARIQHLIDERMGTAATWPSGCATSCPTRPAPGTSRSPRSR